MHWFYSRFPWGKRYGGWGYKILRISYENSDRMVKCHQQHSDTPPIASTTLYCKNLLTCLFLFKTKIIGLFSLSPTAWYSAFTHVSACCSLKGMGGKKMWSYWQYFGLNKYPESFFFLFFALLFFSFLSFFLFFNSLSSVCVLFCFWDPTFLMLLWRILTWSQNVFIELKSALPSLIQHLALLAYWS